MTHLLWLAVILLFLTIMCVISGQNMRGGHSVLADSFIERNENWFGYLVPCSITKVVRFIFCVLGFGLLDTARNATL